MRGAAHRGGARVRLTAGRLAASFVAAAALAGCGGGVHHTTPSSEASVAKGLPRTTSAARAATSTTTTTPRHPTPVSPRLAHLRGTLTRALGKAGPATGALVYDLTAKTALFAVRANQGRPPASLEKLYTTVALLTELDPNLRLSTGVLGVGHLGRGGVWHGDLYVRGGGDPTLGDGGFNRVWEQGYGPTANDLVTQLRRAGIRRVTGWVIGDGTVFDGLRGGLATAYGPDVPDFGGQLAGLTYDHGTTSPGLSPPAFAAKELVLTMRGAHIRAKAARRTGPTPQGAHALASVRSPPLSVMLELMDVPSDDFFAEMLTKQLGKRYGGSGSIQAGAEVIGQVIASLGLHPTILDGSGLSRSDRSSPSQVVDLLRTVWNTPNGRALAAALPVVGVNGTVRRIGAHTAAQGRCSAKTGTLNYVTNLAGYCHARGGHTLAFAVMLDGPANWTAYKLLNPIVAVIARY